MTGRRARPRAGLVATAALSLLVAGCALVWLLPRGTSPPWREVAFRRYARAREALVPVIRPPGPPPASPGAPPRRASRVTEPGPGEAPRSDVPPSPRTPADPLALVPRSAFRLEKERVAEPLRRPLALPHVASAEAPPMETPGAGGAPLAPTPLRDRPAGGVPLLAPTPLPVAGEAVAGRPVERARSVESRRGGFSGIVGTAK